MAQPVWARAYLRSQGQKDEDIGYENGAVTLKKKPFFYTSPNEEGKAMGSQNELDSAFRAFQGNDLLDQYRSNITKPVQPFTYDARSIKKDPLYTSGLQSFTSDTSRGTNQALVNLGRRGIGNSQSAVTAELSGQQNISDFANTKLAPQVIAQKYQQYLDANNLQDKQNQGLLGLAGVYDQQANAGLNRMEKTREGNIENARKLSEDYGFGVLPKESGEELFKQVEGRPTIKAQTEQRQRFTDLVNNSDKLGYVTPELAQLLGIPAFTSTLSAQKEINDAAYQMGMLGVARQGATTSAGRLSWEQSPDNPANQPKPASKNELESQYVTGFDQLAPEVRKQVFKDEKATIIKDLGQSGYSALYNMYFDQYGEPKE